MKVLLVKDVYKLGRAGDVKKVADGYGRNYLLPQGLGVLATPRALSHVEHIRTQAAATRQSLNQELSGVAAKLNKLVLAFPARAGETGKLYGSITPQMIVDAPSGSEYDCSLVQRLSPDSPEARQIVDEFVADYKKDFPTEYMAIEELWREDKLGEYAVVQGRVTQEENNLIAVQQTERGYVMVASYVVNMPGAKHAVIPEYFIGELPDAPAELFHCLNLSRYVGESKP